MGETIKRTHENPQNPLVSVVMPAYNEEKYILKSLEAFCNQTFTNFELIVADNNSTDNTAQIARDFGAIVVTAKEKGVGHARQAGFTKAKGEIIASTDSDTMVPPDWLEKIAKKFSEDKEMIAYGGMIRLYSGPWTAKFAARYLHVIFIYFDRIMSGGWNLIGSNMAIRRDAFLKTGGFKVTLTMGEDIDLSAKLHKVGKVVFDTNFYVFASGRRFNKGFIHGFLTYAPSNIMRLLFKQEKFLDFPDIR